MSGPSLETRGLTKQFGSFTALSQLSLSLSGPKCVGFLGPNGAGKTTALKLLTDMIYPTQGEAFLNGVSVQKNRKAALAHAGVLIENPEIYPSLSPREALEMVGRLRGMRPEEIRTRTSAVLEEVKMAEWVDRKVGRFSKGMKQRIHIAVALLHDPEILLLDEPSTGLDPRGMAEVRNIVRGLKRSRRLIFMSSHILSEVVDVCDEVALVDHGHLKFHDTLAAVTARFAKGGAAIEARFASPVSDEICEGQIARIPGVSACSRIDERRLRLTVTGDSPERARLLEALAGLHLGLVAFQESGSALEDVYMEQVARGD